MMERARRQWLEGHWPELASLDEDQIANHADRAKLALLVCAANLQVGDLTRGRRFAELARAGGCEKRTMAQILTAGVHNTLARAALLLEPDSERVNRHFRKAVQGVAAYEAWQASQTRLANEVNALQADVEPCADATWLLALGRNMPHPATAGLIRKGATSITVNRGPIHDLGMAWAATTVNTVIFRHHGVLTDGRYQFTAFYVDGTKLRVVRRCLDTEEIETSDLHGRYNLRDAHNSISLGIDRSGFVHISYDHHGTQLRYRRSLEVHGINAWTEELSMTGIYEEKVTYPSFLQASDSRAASPFMLLYRDGTSSRGTARIKTYDEVARSWIDRPLPILSGADQKPWTSNAYWNRPVRGTDGCLHLSFVWRTDAVGEDGLVNNINVCYAKSYDDGLTWVTSKDIPYLLPITQVNAETVHAVSPGSNLINQTGMGLDSHNRPHIVFYADDANGVPQYQHVWQDGGTWRHQVISRRRKAFKLKGAGTLPIPISRPEVLLDDQDNVYVIYRGDSSDDRMIVERLTAPDYDYDKACRETLWDEDLGFSEPVIDKTRWEREKILTMLLQSNRQPHGDQGGDEHYCPVRLVDFHFA